jgi:hypothetical protein
MEKRRQKAPKDQKNIEQIAAFRKAANELGCDDSEEMFQDVLRKLAKAKPQPQSKKQKRS